MLKEVNLTLYQRQSATGEGIANKPMEQKRKSRNIPTQLWQSDF